ncbi:MAG TPA: response regulator transcription factor [Actinomycetota bacterium]|nr:response regulator transcription factor [Actinomycetota bacterium]HMC52017.1 response regulator transcription factor [Acidimicrobiales bacterium]
MQRAQSVQQAAARILIVDDEPRILNFVARELTSQGYEVRTAAESSAGLAMATAEAYDLVILDLLMPGLDGRDVLQRILKRNPNQAVIVLSALGDPGSKVMALELGAEDYLAKPFSIDELLARVRARLRRSGERNGTVLHAGRLLLDVVRREADVGSGRVPLAEREFLLLQELMRNVGRTVSKEWLLRSVWGYWFASASNVVDVYVARLRRKVGAETIVTVRGEGYRVDAV